MIASFFPPPPPALSVQDAILILPNQAGVYFLYQSSHCVYVGEALSLRDRLKKHEHIKKADGIGFMLCDPYQRKRIESYYIGLIDPPLNKTSKVFAKQSARPADGRSCVRRVWDAIPETTDGIGLAELHRKSWKSSSSKAFHKIVDRMERWGLIARGQVRTAGRNKIVVVRARRAEA